MLNEIFSKKKLNKNKLAEYGFLPFGNGYSFKTEIMNGDFILQILFDLNGNPDTKLTECETDEEYVLYKTSAEGVFVGQVRGAIADILQDIAEKCFDSSDFKYEQTSELLNYAFAKHGDEPEFLWDKTPENCILRRKDSKKWYAALLTIPKNKLGIDSKQIVEIVNLHASREKVASLLSRQNFYPAWHMNKRSWFTVILDGSVENDELFELLDESYCLAKK